MRKWLTIVGGGLMVAACGGGGGSGESSTVPVSTGSPTPAPTPTPTPTATPTPTPAPSYARYADLTGSRSFQTACAALQLNTLPPTPQPAFGFGEGLTLAYAASGGWTISGDGVAVSFATSDAVSAATGQRSYERSIGGSTQRFTITDPTVAGTVFDYTRSFALRTDRTSGPALYSCVFGVPTTLADRPVAAVSYGKVAITGTAYVSDGSGNVQTYTVAASTGTASYDPTAGALVVSMKLAGNLQTAGGTATAATDLGTFAGSGAVDATRGKLYGQLDSADRISRFSSFGGWFFGTSETAVAFEILATDPNTGNPMSVVGTLAAAR